MTPDPNAMLDLFELPPDGPIWAWAEDNVIIPARTPTNFPGPYRSELAMYARDILDMIRDPRYQTIVFEKGAQIGATMMSLVALAYWCAVDPGPVLLVYPSEDIARSQSETRVMPVFEDSPALAKLIPHDRKSCWTKLQYRLLKNVVNWAGSNSPANLASRAVRYLILDETDKYPSKTGDEADPVSLAIQRTKTFQDKRKIILLSTPTSSTGHIHRNFMQGDRRYLFLPCPHCGYMQSLKWSQVKFNAEGSIDDAARAAFYECEGCKGRIMDGHKAEMLKRREWRSTAVSVDPSMISIHLSSLYSPWVSFGSLVRKFLVAKSNPEQLQDFINSELGEPFDPIDTRIYSDTIAEREGEYPDGADWAAHPAYKERFKDLARNADYATIIGVDVQKGYLRYVARTFMRDGGSAHVMRGELSGFPALLKIADSLIAEYIGIDMRYRGQEVLEFCYDNSPGFTPVYGMTRKCSTVVSEDPDFDIDEGKKRVGPTRRVLSRFAIADDQAKDILANCVQQIHGAPLWLVGKGTAADRIYCNEMSAEARINGKWVNPRQAANHYWDCEKIALAMAIAFGYWQWKKEEEK
jgi:phage terminase large subunit GpA-like protein